MAAEGDGDGFRIPDGNADRATAKDAQANLCNGFKDSTGRYLTNHLHSGVWLSDVPLDINEGARGDVLLEVELDATEDELAPYERREEGKPYRSGAFPPP
ncbi:MAG: hypothetical protein WBC04_21870 [Candidatus Acidiferrales bacterium]